MPVAIAPPPGVTRRLPPPCLWRSLVRVALILVAQGLAPAPTAAECLAGRVADAGDVLILDQPVAGSESVRLAGILAPSPADAAVAAAARSGLAAIVAGQCLRLVPDQPPVDRHRRLVARVYRADGLLVQADLVSQGLVRVLPGLDDAPLADLLALESAARREGRGLWADPAYRVRTPEDVVGDVGSVQLVEGTVRRTARVGATVYLNFGDDWRTDFTVAIPARRLAAFAAAGRDPQRLAGRPVRIRGLVQDVNGPLIEIEAPEALELLEGARQGARQVIRLATETAP